MPFYAVVAQLVEHQLPKLRAAGSSPVYRSNKEIPVSADADSGICVLMVTLAFFCMQWLQFSGK